MKAAEWAERFQAAAGDSLADEFKRFIDEIHNVAKQRGGTINAIEGAVREQRMKWAAVLGRYPAISGFKFDQLLGEYGGDFKDAEQRYQARLAKTKAPDKLAKGNGFNKKKGRKNGRVSTK